MNARNAALSLLCAVVVALPVAAAPSANEPPETPAEIVVSVRPDASSAGEAVEVEVRLEPKPGIKINRYPRISVDVAAVDGIVGPAAAAVGSERPPSSEDVEAGRNYFKVVDPVRLELPLDASAPAGRHVVPAKLKYFYCVSESGFCAPKKATIDIPITVR